MLAECWSLETSLAETCLGETNLVSVSVSTRQSLGESLSRSRQTRKSRGSRDRTVYFIESFQAVSIFVSAKQKGKSLGSCLVETKLRKVSVSVSRDNFSVSINTLHMRICLANFCVHFTDFSWPSISRFGQEIQKIFSCIGDNRGKDLPIDKYSGFPWIYRSISCVTMQ